MTARLTALLILGASGLFAQAGRFDSSSTVTNNTCAPSVLCPVLAVPGTAVSVCTGSQTSLNACQSSPATTYSSASQTSPCPGTSPLTPAAGGACVATVDKQGKFGFWAAPGNYSYLLYPPSGGALGPYSITIGVTLGSGLVDRHGLVFPIGQPGSGVALTTSSRSGTLTVPFGCTIGLPTGSKYSVAFGPADAGTVTVKFWKIAGGSAIPTVSNVINTAGLTLSGGGTAAQSATLTDFTTLTVTANDMIVMAITAITGTVDSLTVILPCGN